MSFYDLLKYAGTGVASGLSEFDKLKAVAMTGSGGGGGMPEKTITGTPPLTFTADGTALKAWIISGNIQYSGTPTPESPIYPQFVGVWDEGNSGYNIPITIGGTTSELQMSDIPLRKIGNYADTINKEGHFVSQIMTSVLDGSESWGYGATQKVFYCDIYDDYMRSNSDIIMICSHYEAIAQVSSASRVNRDNTIAMYYNSDSGRIYVHDERFDNTTSFKYYLSTQSTNGTPVTIHYVMQETCDEYYDDLILTPKVGSNTLSFGTTVQPSSVTITGNIE